MINIVRAIKDKRYFENEDGTFTCHGSVNIRKSRPATAEEVAVKPFSPPYAVGACVYEDVVQEIEVIIASLTPLWKVGDVVENEHGRFIVSDIDPETGDCTMRPDKGSTSHYSFQGRTGGFGLANVYQGAMPTCILK
jgi:hypothetical protein